MNEHSLKRTFAAAAVAACVGFGVEWSENFNIFD